MINDVGKRRSRETILQPLDKLAAGSVHLIRTVGVRFEADNNANELPCHQFVGPQGGDEPVGSHALIRFLQLLEKNPEGARGYHLYIYPVCNPTGYEDNTRLSRSGRDLNREFWKGSAEP